MSIFQYDNDQDYTNQLDPVNDYIKQATNYLSRYVNLPIEACEVLIRSILKSQPVRNPKVTFRERTLDGEISVKTTSLKGYTDYVKKNKDILVPSYTVYFNPNKKRSLHSDFTKDNITKRNKHKKKGFVYEMEGDKDKYLYHNTLQKAMKIYNNSLSGTYVVKGTILQNPSAHYTLTSMTRCISGIGNMVSESMISGNKHFRKKELVINYIFSLLTVIDMDRVEQMIHKYHLTIPNDEQIMENLMRSSRKYWEDKSYELELYRIIKTLDFRERVALSYVNDFYHMRKYNSSFVRKILKEILTYSVTEHPDPVAILNTGEGWELNLLHHLHMDMLEGIDPKYNKLDRPTLNILASSFLRIKEVFLNYKDLIQTFFVTDLLPIDIAYLRNMLREAIVLSDTDSTCATYQDWVEWYFEENKVVFGNKATAISAIVMTFVTQTIDHYIRVFGANMNISPESVKHLKMKNEFYWTIFVNANVSKHYYSGNKIKEGNVYKLFKLEKKGVHLIAPNSLKEVRTEAEKIMKDIIATLEAGKRLSMVSYLKRVASVEQSIIKKFTSGSPDVYRTIQIKNPTSYKQGENNAVYQQHLLWEEVFKKKYGEAPDLPYMAYKVPLAINNKTEMGLFINSISDSAIHDSLLNYIERTKKTVIKNIRVPMINASNHGVPKEIIEYNNINTMVFDNCNVLYIILETIGFYRKPTEMILDHLNDNKIIEFSNLEIVA